MLQLDPQSAELLLLFCAGFSFAEQLSSRKVEAVSQPAPAPRRRRRSKYDDKTRSVCLNCWYEARQIAAVRAHLNTRTTYKAAFEYFKRILVGMGVKTVAAFKRIIHAVQSRKCEDRRKELEARRECERNAGTVPASGEAEFMLKALPSRSSIRKIFGKAMGAILRGLSPHGRALETAT